MSCAACTRCETLPDEVIDPGVLHLRMPLTHTVGKLISHLTHSLHPFQHEGGRISISCEPADLRTLTRSLMEALSAAECNDISVLFQPRGRTLQLDDFMDVCSLPRFAARLDSSPVVRMIREERLTSVFQPIVPASAPTTVFAYECLLRGMDGGRLTPPGPMFDVARDSGLLFQLDLAARRTAIREASRHGITANLFINFAPNAIYDPAFCLRSTTALMDELGLRRDQVVFEVIETDQTGDVDHLRNILRWYRNAGCRVALDDLGSGFSSLNLLHELRPDFVKLDRALISGVHVDPYKAVIVRKLLEAAHDLGLRTIAEGVEHRAEFEWLRRHGVDYVQGYYFARPAAPPPLPRFPDEEECASQTL